MGCNFLERFLPKLAAKHWKNSSKTDLGGSLDPNLEQLGAKMVAKSAKIAAKMSIKGSIRWLLEQFGDHFGVI